MSKDEQMPMFDPSEGRDALISLTGDALITRRLRPYREPAFLNMLSKIRRSDISFTNLEGLLTDYDGVPAASSGGTYVVGEPEIADDLKWAGFNLFARANNHSVDWSHGGLLATSEELDRRDIVHAGVGANLALARSPAYLDTAAGRAALISASSTFPNGAYAGRQRPDMPGRPGLNPLRYKRWLEIPEKEMNHLRRISREIGFEKMRKERSKMRPSVAKEKEKEKEPGEFRLGSMRFDISKDNEYRMRTKVDPDDRRGNLDAIRGATRQSDWVIYSIHSHESQIPKHRQPAEFLCDFARQAIDAGADVVVGHGPHHLRGVEIYQGRPIFYSLGNFIFQNETVRYLPQDIYDRYELDLLARPDELYDTRTDSGSSGFPSHEMYWRSVLVEVEFSDSQLAEIVYYPVTLGHELPRSRRGRPVLATGELARDIINEIAALSEPFGTNIVWDEKTQTGRTVVKSD